MKFNDIELKKNLPKKGFEIDPSKDHIYYYFTYKGKKTGIFTKISHSSRKKIISGDLLKNIKKQLKLDSNSELIDLIKCPMSEEDYIDILKNNGNL